MNRSTLAALCLLAALPASSPSARAEARRHFRHDVSLTDTYRPLTIGRPRRRAGPRRGGDHGGIIYRQDEIIAPGGFSAHGYGPGDLGSEANRRAYRNADVRARTDGVYGYGLDGLGGTELFGDRGESGYNNPTWGNAFNTYTGYNGVPSALAFGPGYANRYIADHEPEFDTKEDAWPSPRDLGYRNAAGDDGD